MAILSGVDRADFKFMLWTLGLSKGNLASHADKLERAGYVEVQKSFNGKMPHTEYRLTDAGRTALASYWAALDVIRANPQSRADS
jgi:DNA-binding MarR family transcriptional regulator